MKRFLATLGADGVPEGAQGKLIGILGQFVGFDASGTAVPQNLPASVIAGTYTGEQPNDWISIIERTIVLGVRPKAVLIIQNGSWMLADTYKNLYGGLAIDGAPIRWGGEYDAIKIVENGFTIADRGYQGDVYKSFLNRQGFTYYYLAFV